MNVTLLRREASAGGGRCVLGASAGGGRRVWGGGWRDAGGASCAGVAGPGSFADGASDLASSCCASSVSSNVALGYLVADLDLEILDYARARRRHIHRRLIGFEGDERIFGLDRVAGLYEYFNDREFLEVTDIGDFDFDRGCSSFGGDGYQGTHLARIGCCLCVVFRGEEDATSLLPNVSVPDHHPLEGRESFEPDRPRACSLLVEMPISAPSPYS